MSCIISSVMKKNLAVGFAAAAFCLVLAVSGCSRRGEATIGSPANPLVVLLSPAHAPSSPEVLPFLKQQLQERSGLSVEVRVAASPLSSIEEFGAHSADIGFLTTEEYLVSRAEYKTSAALQVLRENDAADYDSVLLVRADSPLKDVQELAGKKVAFSDAYSASGFMMPAIYFDKAGIKVEPKFAGGHSAAVKMLLDGQADAAATYGLPSRPGVKVLLKLGVLPNEPVVVRKGLSPEKSRLVVDALLALAATDDGRKAFSAIASINGFRPVNEDAYKPVHEMLRSARKSVYDLVPAGWDIQRLNRYSAQDGL